MPLTISNRPGDKRPMKIQDERGKTVATSTTFDKAEADIRRRYEGEKKEAKDVEASKNKT